jgi:hypothetical protein
VDVHRSGSPFGCHSRPPFLKLPTSCFFLVSTEMTGTLGFGLADHSLGLVVEGGDDLVGVLFRAVKSQAADREFDDFMTVPRSRPG